MGKSKKKSLEKLNEHQTQLVPEPSKKLLEQPIADESEYQYVQKPSIPQHSRQAAFSLLYLLLFSVLMFSLPFGAFFGVRHYLEMLNLETFQINFLSVIACVVTVNVIIIAYAIVAYRETEYDDEGNVIDFNAIQPQIADISEPAIPSSKKKEKKKKN